MFDIVQTTLSAAVPASGTFTVGYPTGRSAGNYAGTNTHKMSALQTVFTCPKDFTVSFGASSITVTYLGSTTLPINTDVTLQFDRLANDDNSPEKVALNKQIFRGGTYVMDLGSPATADADGYCVSQSVSAGANATITGALASGGVGYPDTPRNVVAAWTGAAVLTVTGTDVDGNTVVEKSASGTSHTGSKAFKTVTAVSFSANVTSATVGTGNKVGLPFYLDDAARVVVELMDGSVLPKKAGKVFLPWEIEATELAAGTTEYVVSPVAGWLAQARGIVQTDIVTGGDITFSVAGNAVTGLTLTVANSDVAGTVYADTPTARHTSASAVAAGDKIGIIPAAAFNGGGAVNGVLELDVTAAGQLDGTLVAGVTSTPTGTTGDVRGTYTPAITPDGTHSYQLIVATADPGNRGAAQYAG
jgi:hypothetical protein